MMVISDYFFQSLTFIVQCLGSLRIYDCFSEFKNYFSDSTLVKKIIKDARLLNCKKWILNGAQINDMSCFRQALIFIEHIVVGHNYVDLPWKEITEVAN